MIMVNTLKTSQHPLMGISIFPYDYYKYLLWIYNCLLSKFHTVNFKELKQLQKCYSGTVFGDRIYVTYGQHIFTNFTYLEQKSYLYR